MKLPKLDIQGRRKSADGDIVHINLRWAESGVPQKYIALGIKFQSVYWDAEKKRAKKMDGYQSINALIDQEMRRAETILVELKVKKFEEFRNKFLGIVEKKSPMLEYMQAFIENKRLKTGLKDNSCEVEKRKAVTIAKVLATFGINFIEDVYSSEVILKLTAGLEKGHYTKNYIRQVLNLFKATLRFAGKRSVLDEKDFADIDDFAYKGNAKPIHPLGFDEATLLINAWDNQQNFEFTPHQKMSLRRAMFQLFTGLAVNEIASLTYGEIKRMKDNTGAFIYCVVIRREKTQHDLLIPLAGKALEAIDLTQKTGLVFDWVTEHQSYNKSLKKIAAKIGIFSNISSHILRHTFATIALQSGMDLMSIQNILGHKKITTTELYAKYDSKGLSDKLIRYSLFFLPNANNLLGMGQKRVTLDRFPVHVQEHYEKIVQEISRQLKDRGWTQVDLAKKLSTRLLDERVSKTMILRWLSPDKSIRILIPYPYLVLIEGVLGVELLKGGE